MAQYRKIYVEDAAVLVVGRRGLAHQFGLRVNNVPVGLAYRAAGPVWCLLEFEPWDDVPLEWRADKDSVPFPLPQEEACPEPTPVTFPDA